MDLVFSNCRQNDSRCFFYIVFRGCVDGGPKMLRYNVVAFAVVKSKKRKEMKYYDY